MPALIFPIRHKAYFLLYLLWCSKIMSCILHTAIRNGCFFLQQEWGFGGMDFFSMMTTKIWLTIRSTYEKVKRHLCCFMLLLSCVHKRIGRMHRKLIRSVSYRISLWLRNNSFLSEEEHRLERRMGENWFSSHCRCEYLNDRKYRDSSQCMFPADVDHHSKNNNQSCFYMG